MPSYRYIAKTPFRTPTHKYVNGQVYELDTRTYESMKARFEPVTEPKKKESPNVDN